MTHECPVCGQDASVKLEIEMGDRWSDVVGRPPHTFFKEYRQVHLGGHEAGALIVYCHSVGDLQSGPF